MLPALHSAFCGNLEFEQDPSERGYTPTAGLAVRFNVATYNVRARPLLDDAESKFAAIAPLLDPFDIVALQECFTAHRSLWGRTTFPVRLYDGSRTSWYRLVSSGLSIMARFPVQQVAVEKFRDPEGLRFIFRAKKDGFASKGVLFARLSLGNGRFLDLYNTHMEAGSDQASNEARRLQTRQLIRFIKENSPRKNAVILLGDFNMRQNPRGQKLGGHCSRDLRAMERHELLEVIIRELGLTNAGRLAGRMPEKLIDHIFYREGASFKLRTVAWQIDRNSFRDKEGGPWSDHDPVIATFVAE